MAWPIDARGRELPTRSADAWSEQEFQDRYIETIVRANLHMYAGYPFPKLDEMQSRKFHATHMKYFSFFAWKFPSFLLSVAAACPYQDVRRTIIEDAVDEEVADVDAGGRCHIDVLYDEAEACGMSREEIAATEATPVILACIHALENLSKSYGWEAGLAAMSALEMGSSVPAKELRQKLLEAELTPEQIEAGKGQRDSRSLSERTGLPAEQLSFAALHAYKDQFHGGGELTLIVKYGATRELQERMLWAAKTSVSVFFVMREEIDRLARASVGLPPGEIMQLKGSTTFSA